MSRIVVGCGAIVDTLLGGISMFGSGQTAWSVTLGIGALSVLSPVAFLLVAMASEAFEQPQVLSVSDSGSDFPKDGQEGP